MKNELVSPFSDANSGSEGLHSSRDRVIAERRQSTARALCEYRAYVAAHDDALSRQLSDIIKATHERLHERRHVLREIGWFRLEKANPA